MAARKLTTTTTVEEPVDIDDLLSLTEEDVSPVAVEASEEPEDGGPEDRALTEEELEDERISALQAELAKPAPKRTYKPESERTEKEQKIAELEDQVARKRQRELDSAEAEYDETDGYDKILLHVLEDGFLINGIVTYRGQEFEFVPGSRAYEDTKDRFGNTWLDIVDDIDAQYERWGRQRVAPGPWRGRKWGDTRGLTNPEEIAATRAAGEREARRNRRPPTLNF